MNFFGGGGEALPSSPAPGCCGGCATTAAPFACSGLAAEPCAVAAAGLGGGPGGGGPPVAGGGPGPALAGNAGRWGAGCGALARTTPFTSGAAGDAATWGRRE